MLAFSHFSEVKNIKSQNIKETETNSDVSTKILPSYPGIQSHVKLLISPRQDPPFLHAGGSLFTTSCMLQYEVDTSQFKPESIILNTL
jgi:hypothetical protein